MVSDIVSSLETRPVTVLDPFGGCGTTAVTCQFLGITPTAIEVNPFLADLTQSKLSQYDLNDLKSAKLDLLQAVDRIHITQKDIDKYPPTFCEPGIKDRWLFSEALFHRILQYKAVINSFEDQDVKRLFKVVLGSCLIPVSNVLIDGKGRKYRKNWLENQSKVDDFEELFLQKLDEVICDIREYGAKTRDFNLLKGDCREQIKNVQSFDLSIFSPPYPNTFDYTDVYNVELWILDYIKSNEQCLSLRSETLRSHVQVKRDYGNIYAKSFLLEQVEKQLKEIEQNLWHKDIPSMVGAYFSDLGGLLMEMRTKIAVDGNIIMVVGDSAYKSIRVPVADILEEIAISIGYKTHKKEVLRKLRTSYQQGRRQDLDETMLWVVPSS
ncbi:hypothetical protein AVO41_08470 [Thiomicrospira sp. WB1]|nr:hypothetical protein AVO41_08470 [Thiomicrospira sp. WB1]